MLAVFVGELGEAPRRVVGKAKAGACVAAPHQPPPQVVFHADGGCRGAGSNAGRYGGIAVIACSILPAARPHLVELALGVVLVVLCAAVRVVDGLQLLFVVVLVAHALACGVGNGQGLAPAGVFVASALARAVGVAGRLPGAGVGDVFAASLGIGDADGFVGVEAQCRIGRLCLVCRICHILPCSCRVVGVVVLLGAAVSQRDLDQAPVEVIFIAGGAPGRIGGALQQAGVFVISLGAGCAIGPLH